jgi:hypothetical protein
VFHVGTCLQDVADGEDYIVLAYRPFLDLQPYAETGPIFLHCRPCERAIEGDDTPPILKTSPDYILRGYGGDNRIVYGTGQVTPSSEIAHYAQLMLKRRDVAYIHVRSARNNCYQVRIERADRRR